MAELLSCCTRRYSLMTIVLRFGNGRPMDSKVLRPMTIVWPVVICLNHLKSSGRCHGILLSQPMTRLRDMAAMALRRFIEQVESANVR